MSACALDPRAAVAQGEPLCDAAPDAQLATSARSGGGREEAQLGRLSRLQGESAGGRRLVGRQAPGTSAICRSLPVRVCAPTSERGKEAKRRRQAGVKCALASERGWAKEVALHGEGMEGRGEE